MIEIILTHLNGLLPSNVFQTVYELAELVTDDQGNTAPMLYQGKGEYKNLAYDSKNSMAYWRNVEVTQEESDFLTGCGDVIDRTYSLKLVGLISRDHLDCDDQYAQDKIADAISRAISGTDVPLKKLLKATKSSITISRYTSDRSEIEADEYVGYQDPKIKFRYLYISMDVEVMVTIRKECLAELC